MLTVCHAAKALCSTQRDKSEHQTSGDSSLPPVVPLTYGKNNLFFCFATFTLYFKGGHTSLMQLHYVFWMLSIEIHQLVKRFSIHNSTLTSFIINQQHVTHNLTFCKKYLWKWSLWLSQLVCLTHSQSPKFNSCFPMTDWQRKHPFFRSFQQGMDQIESLRIWSFDP